MQRRIVIPKVHALIACIGFAAFAAGVIWVTRNDIAVFERNHRHLLENEAASAAVSVQQFVSDRQRFVEAFVDEKQDLLAALYRDPENEALRTAVTESLERWFPTFFTFTLADADGNDLIADIDGFVGDACVRSIRRFLDRREAGTGSDKHLYEPEIHPQAFNYHFDMMAPWRPAGITQGVFFVSFTPDTIEKILGSYETDGHELIVVHRDRENLIEVTSAGSRDEIASGREIELTPMEVSRVLVRRPIEDTRWDIVGLPAPGLFDTFAERRMRVAGGLVFVVGLASLLAVLAIGVAEGRRRAAQIATEEANRQLKQEIAIKDRFFSIIGHDLKSPFTTLLGLSDIMVRMSESLTKEQIVEYADKINLSGKRVFALLDNLLEWARFQMDKDNVDLSEFAIQDVIDKTLEIMEAPAGEKTVQLTAAPTSFRVNADFNMVLLVLRNLVANAIKFTPKGGKISIETEATDEFVEIAARDTGGGIDPAIIDDLFAVDKKTTTLGTNGEIGTGLGLPLCREMIEANGGSIWVESEKDRGSIFRFTLRAA